MRFPLIHALIILLSVSILAQQKSTIQDIRREYESFSYQAVITLSVEILLHRDTISAKNFIEIQLMKGVSHFVLNETQLTRRCFVEILKTDSTYQIDTEKISPKIARLFSDVKNEYMQSIQQERAVTPSPEPIKKSIHDTVYVHEAFNRQSFLKSLVFPGWGHLDLSLTDVKGWTIASATLLNTSALIYYIFDTNTKEKRYLGENDQSLIRSKYNDYNSSYKTRNVLISSLVCIWLYTQIDYLFLHNDIPVKLTVSYDPKEQLNNSNKISLLFHLNL